MSGVSAICAYGSYAFLSAAWLNPYLVSLSLYLFILLPFIARFATYIDTETTTHTNSILLGKAVRFIFQCVSNIFVLWFLVSGSIVTIKIINEFGGTLIVIILVTSMSKGVQYLFEEIGLKYNIKRNISILLALSLSIIINAAAVTGVMWIKAPFIMASYSIAAILLISWGYTDLKNLVFNPQSTTQNPGEPRHE